MRHFSCSKSNIFHYVAGLTLVSMLSICSAADNYPNRPVSIVVPFAAGGSGDLSARITAAGLSEELGQSVLIDNRPGAAGNIGYSAGAKAAPDGYTLTWLAQTIAVNPHLYPRTSLDPKNSFSPISQVVAFYQILVAYPSGSNRNLTEVLASAREKPGVLFYSSGGTGGAAHLAMELLLNMTNAKMTHVPYKSEAPSMNGLVAGEVAVGFLTLSTAMPLIKAGKLLPLATGGPKRLAALPSVPTVLEIVPGYSASGWFGLAAPAKTPPDIVALLAKRVRDITQKRSVRDQLSTAEFDVIAGTPQEFSNTIDSEYQTYGKLIRERGIRVD